MFLIIYDKLLQNLVHKKKIYTRLFTFLKVAIGVFLFIYLYNQISSTENIVEVFLKADTMWISLAIILMIPNILFQSLKWFFLIKTVNHKFTFWNSIASTLGGMSLGVLTPGRIGELGKGLFLNGVEKYQITGLALLDRIINMTTILITGIISLIFILKDKFNVPEIIYIPLSLFVILSLFFVIYILINPDILRFFYSRYERLHSIKEQAKQFFSALKLINGKTLVYTFLSGLVFQFIVALQFFMLVHAYDSSLTTLNGLMSSYCTTLTQAFLPISIGDIGIRENAAVYYFGFFISNKAAIFNGALTLFTINVLFPSLCGIFMLPKLNFQKDL